MNFIKDKFKKSRYKGRTKDVKKLKVLNEQNFLTKTFYRKDES